MVKVGDKVRVRKPGNGGAVFPYWVDGMDKFDGKEVIVSDIGNETFFADGWQFSYDWTCEPSLSQSPTLLDQFAMAALTGLLSNETHIPGLKDIGAVTDAYSGLAYQYAQAMMKAREVQK